MRMTLGWGAPVCRALVCFVAASATVGGTAVCFGATDSVAIVELQCKITPGTTGGPLNAWLFELRKSSGELVHLQMVLDGQTVKIRNLSPAIYIGCLSGQAGRESCESMDLNVPQNKNSLRIRKQLATPRVNAFAADEHVVGTARLAVPEEAYAEVLAAQKAQIQGEDEQARGHLERALQIYPDYPQALNNLGTFYYRSGQYAESLALLTKATALDPDFYPAWVNMAGSLIALARFDAALSAIQRALELRPNDALANSRAGMAYYYKRDYAEATKYFRKSLDLDPAAASTPQLFLAHIALGQGRLAEAEKYLREYLQVHPNAPDAAHLRMTLKRIESGAIDSAPVIPDR